MMCSPMIQKDIINACAKETIKVIIEDLDGNFFGILVDESKDISHKEQMTFVLRYVNKEGEVIERFVGIIHVNDTSAQSLKKKIDSFLLYHSLSSSQIRRKDYDGASNMQGELRGLKTLIMNETPLAHCIHYFAHQLQLTLVALVVKHSDVNDFFCIVTNVLNIVGASFKRRDLLRQYQAEKLEELLISGEVYTGRGLNQERGLQRPVLMMTNDLSSSLQRMDQDIVNSMGLLTHTKQRLQTTRNSEFESLMVDVSSFCDKHEILIPKMDARYFPGKSKRRALDVTYSHHLHFEIFNDVIDLHLQELNSHFDDQQAPGS
ncbi:uncharacterized protein [Nicotiana tomentosiformis]|uniref:uncharacterized protein isoform X2 n=1 Tax=Nicotiana tomentosiformis TaxID=4098 RepID=UPI00051B336C|nr:zinc finger MYM-type protein 1-like [Nicotiana tomentosiformis]